MALAWSKAAFGLVPSAVHVYGKVTGRDIEIVRKNLLKSLAKMATLGLSCNPVP